MDKGTLNYHLKILRRAGLVDNFIRNGEIEPERSYYRNTPLFKSIIEGFKFAFRPKYNKWQSFYVANALGTGNYKNLLKSVTEVYSKTRLAQNLSDPAKGGFDTQLETVKPKELKRKAQLTSY